MTDSCGVAFKEWSVIVQALLEGRQTLLLRKGGISENEGRFAIESDEFFLYPTKVHQSPESLINADHQQLLQAADNQIFSDHVNLLAFARVERYERIRDWNRIVALRPYHVWADSVISQRFAYGNEDWLDLFVLQVFRLAAPIQLANDAKFAGCKSWVHLAVPLSITNAIPIKPSATFQQALQGILKA